MRVGRSTGARGILALLALSGLVLSALWLLASAAAMTGGSAFVPDWSVVDILLRETMIGPLLAIRALALLLIILLLFVPGRAERPAAIALLAMIAAATLAWSGHAGATEGVAGTVHRAADVLHIVAASAWFGALLSLLGRVLRTTLEAQEAEQTARMLHGFSLFGTLFVITLIVSGVINSVMIVGFANSPVLLHSSYGWLLLTKLALFGGMLIIAAANRWRLTPTLMRATGANELSSAAAHLRLSLAFETMMALGILALVAALGTLDPLAT
jgi:putative copper resistance protein D